MNTTVNAQQMLIQLQNKLAAHIQTQRPISEQPNSKVQKKLIDAKNEVNSEK